jgi:putative ATPase
MDRALSDVERGLGGMKARIEPDARHHLATVADGDARRCLNALELAVLSTQPDAAGEIVITLAAAEESVQQKTVVYDGDGDAHYDTISAFIKSMRASDPDAALYWLAKMLYAGEDIRFIARRIVIAASEDVGMADSNALRVAVAAQQAVEFIGMPEARIILAHATIYNATAPKSNRCLHRHRCRLGGCEKRSHAAGAEAPAGRASQEGREGIRPRGRLHVSP